MLNEDTVIMLDDNKEYYVLDSLMRDDKNYIMIGEIDSKTDVITDRIKIMYYDSATNKVKKVTDSALLFNLVVSFADRN